MQDINHAWVELFGVELSGDIQQAILTILEEEPSFRTLLSPEDETYSEKIRIITLQLYMVYRNIMDKPLTSRGHRIVSGCAQYMETNQYEFLGLYKAVPSPKLYPAVVALSLMEKNIDRKTKNVFHRISSMSHLCQHAAKRYSIFLERVLSQINHRMGEVSES